MLKFFKICIFIISICSFDNNWLCRAHTPIVMWHGMGDACCFPFSLGYIEKRLKETLPGVYVVSIEIGNTVIEDVENGYFMHPDKQILQVCSQLQNNSLLVDGFHAIGFSQGAQFIRGLIQRCSKIKVKAFVSLGGQHQGVYGLPNCASLSHKSCDYIRRLLNYAAYDKWVQDFLVQATYWHDPLNEKEYKEKSSFLANINNELYINTSYIENLQAIENFVLVKFENDSIVQPIETEWFGFYKAGQARDTETLEESSLYKTDRLGLRKMKSDGKLHFLSVLGNHLQFKWDWFVNSIINKYF